MKLNVAVVLIAVAVCPSSAFGQKKPGPIAPAEALKDGQWEEIDKRFLFLMVRLANLEASLDAVENVIARSTGKRSANQSAAKRAEAGNERMDRQGGGPMKWSEFYGRNAEKFFYHPVDPNTSYGTITVLRQNGPEADNKVGGGVPASQGLPVHQRPPQFDYIYRANENAKARAEQEAGEFKGKIEALLERRQRLESEQNGLWCEIAFRAVLRHDLPRKPLYRFEPLIVEVDTESRLHAETIKAASTFMLLALSIVEQAQKDQSRALTSIKTVVADGRKNLDDAWLRQAVDSSDLKTATGKFFALAKLLDDAASNLSESYEVATEGDEAKDHQRKDTFRALLQESLVSYAQIVLALDEMAGVMAKDWKFKPDVDKPIQMVLVSGPFSAGRPSNVRNLSRPSDEQNGGSKTKNFTPIGAWLERRPDTAVGDRVRTFLNDGSLTVTLTKTGQRFKGSWRQDGKRFFFSVEDSPSKSTSEKWFEIASLSDSRLVVKMDGIRPYTWEAAEGEESNANLPSSARVDKVVQANTVWVNDKNTLTILERRGDQFRGRFAGGPFVREVAGTVKDGKLSWLAKDVRMLKGSSPGGDNYGTINGETIDFVFRGGKGGMSGTYALHLKR